MCIEEKEINKYICQRKRKENLDLCDQNEKKKIKKESGSE